jgi:hypothetical protein
MFFQMTKQHFSENGEDRLIQLTKGPESDRAWACPEIVVFIETPCKKRCFDAGSLYA